MAKRSSCGGNRTRFAAVLLWNAVQRRASEIIFDAAPRPWATMKAGSVCFGANVFRNVILPNPCTTPTKHSDTARKLRLPHRASATFRQVDKRIAPSASRRAPAATSAHDLRRQNLVDRKKESADAGQYSRQQNTAVQASSRLELNMPNNTTSPAKIPIRLITVCTIVKVDTDIPRII